MTARRNAVMERVVRCPSTRPARRAEVLRPVRLRPRTPARASRTDGDVADADLSEARVHDVRTVAVAFEPAVDHFRRAALTIRDVLAPGRRAVAHVVQPRGEVEL